jgi:ABC-2 type transport system ATP-binding protein
MSMVERADTTTYAIDARGLGKRFGDRIALDDLWMRVPFGTIYGLVGANGGGKSTSLRLLAGLLACDAGTATVLGYELPQQRDGLRNSIGYLPQRNWLYSELSVRENLRFRAEVFGLKAANRAVEIQIRAFGLDALGSTPVALLSGGWCRQVELAAVLIHRPRVLLLDEPTAGLDPAARKAIWRRLISLAAQGAAIVVSTHDLEEAQRCSYLFLLNSGRVRAHGRPQDIAVARRSEEPE